MPSRNSPVLKWRLASGLGFLAGSVGDMLKEEAAKLHELEADGNETQER